MKKDNMNEEITLEYGNGGKKTSGFIKEMILPVLGNETLNRMGDGALINLFDEGKIPKDGHIAFSTDSFVVNPPFFPGGDIGKLAVCGTVNDIAVSGGVPKYISLAAIIEEGFKISDLKKIINSIKKAADEAGVEIVTGDTKVVERGKGDGIYLNTSGIGTVVHNGLSVDKIKEGDAVIVSGPVGNHGMAVMLARNPAFLQNDIKSDCAPVFDAAASLFGLKEKLKILRDPTRGGLATTLCEFLDDGLSHEEENEGLCIEVNEQEIPINEDVKAACEILGLDPLYLACEGRLVAVVDASAKEDAIRLLREISGCENAAVIGNITRRYPGRVVLNTRIGGVRILSKLSGNQLPRIC